MSERVQLIIDGGSSGAVKALQDTERGLERLQQAERGVASTSATVANRMDALARAQSSARGSAAELAASHRQIESASRQAAGGVGALNAKLANMGAAREHARGLTREVDRLGTSLIRIGTIGAAGMAGALKIAADLGSKMSFVQARTRSSVEEMARFRAEALRLGNDPRFAQFSASDVAGGMGIMAQGGVRPGDIIGGGAEGVAALAAAGPLGIEQSAQIAVDALNIFHQAGSELPRIADYFANAANVTATSVGELGSALSRGGGAVEAFNRDALETVTAYALLANHGQRAERAGTRYGMFLTKLALTSDTAAEAAAKHNLQFTDSEGNFRSLAELAGELQTKLGHLSDSETSSVLEKIFGSDAAKAATVMMKEGAAGVEAMTATIERQGTASEMAIVQNDNLAGSFAQLKSTVSTTAAVYGQELEPAARGVISAVTDLVGWLGKEDSATAAVTRSLITAGTVTVLLTGITLKASAAVTTYKLAKTLLRNATAAETVAEGASTAARTVNTAATFRATAATRGLTGAVASLKVGWAGWAIVATAALALITEIVKQHRKLKDVLEDNTSRIDDNARALQRAADAGYLAADATRQYRAAMGSAQQPSAGDYFWATAKERPGWQRMALGGPVGEWLGNRAQGRIDAYEASQNRATRGAIGAIGSTTVPTADQLRNRFPAPGRTTVTGADLDIPELPPIPGAAGGAGGGGSAAAEVNRAQALARAGYGAVGAGRVFSNTVSQCSLAVSTLAKEAGVLSRTYQVSTQMLAAMKDHPDRFRQLQPGEAIPTGSIVAKPYKDGVGAFSGQAGWHAMLAIDQGKLAGSPRAGAAFQVQHRDKFDLPQGWVGFAPRTGMQHPERPQAREVPGLPSEPGRSLGDILGGAILGAVPKLVEQIADAASGAANTAGLRLGLEQSRADFARSMGGASTYHETKVGAARQAVWGHQREQAKYEAISRGDTSIVEQTELRIQTEMIDLARQRYETEKQIREERERAARWAEQEARQQALTTREQRVDVAALKIEKLELQGASAEVIARAETARTAALQALGAERARQGDKLGAMRVDVDILRNGQRGGRGGGGLMDAIIGGDEGEIRGILQRVGRTVNGAPSGGDSRIVDEVRSPNTHDLERDIRRALAVRDRDTRKSLLRAIGSA